MVNRPENEFQTAERNDDNNCFKHETLQRRLQGPSATPPTLAISRNTTISYDFRSAQPTTLQWIQQRLAAKFHAGYKSRRDGMLGDPRFASTMFPNRYQSLQAGRLVRQCQLRLSSILICFGIFLSDYRHGLRHMPPQPAPSGFSIVATELVMLSLNQADLIDSWWNAVMLP